MSLVSVKVHAPGGTIVMQDAPTRNALSRAMVEAIDQALDDLHQEKRVRAVIITGAGSGFSSGMNLKELHAARERDDRQALAELHADWVRVAELLQKMLRYPKPLIAAVDGEAFGAGLALALGSDLVVASERARFAAPAATHGLIGGLVAPLLVFRLGAATAARLLLAHESLGAAEAQAAGLICTPVRSDQIWVAADNLARQCATAPAESLQLTKRLLNETIGETLASQLTVGAGMGATACSTESAAEGLAAFSEKRDAVWP